jgi:hypothetical protein
MANAKTESKFTRYEDRQKAKGLMKVHPWIPIEDEIKVKAYCERLRKSHAKKASK